MVHESAGFSTLACLKVVGNRAWRKGESVPAPHNLTMVLIGTAILWFGWFGFNGGSALTIGGLATIAFVNTQIAPSVAMLTWLLIEWQHKGRPTLTGACAGVVAGLVVITPAAGFVQPEMAFMAGILGTSWCYCAVEAVKRYTDLDDTCETFGVHGMAGFLGTILVGALADGAECSDAENAPGWCANPGTVTRSMNQLFIQTFCAIVSAAYSFGMTYLLMKCLYTFYPILLTPDQQDTTRDLLAHGEVAYVISSAECLDDDDDEDYDEDGCKMITPRVSARDLQVSR